MKINIVVVKYFSFYKNRSGLLFELYIILFELYINSGGVEAVARARWNHCSKIP